MPGILLINISLSLYVRDFYIFLPRKSNVCAMTDPKDFAPGAPGMDPYRVKTALQGIGTSFHNTSRVYFSLSR